MRKGQKIILAVMSVIVVILAAVFILTVKKQMDFNNSLPIPENATEIYFNTFPDGTVLIDDKLGRLVVVNESTSFQNFLPTYGKYLYAIILNNATDELVEKVCGFSSNVEILNIYVPFGISKENVKRLLDTYPECNITKVKKGSQAVSGEQQVLNFCGTEQDMAFVLVHGYDSYFYASNLIDKVSGLKNESFLLSYCSVECLTQSAFTVNNAVLTAGDCENVDAISEYAYNYATLPAFNSMFHGNGKGGYVTDYDLLPTGKIGEW